MRSVLYADGLEINVTDKLGKADSNDESNSEND